MFDNSISIEKLRQVRDWINEAIPLAHVGTIESLLRFYEVGYTSGNLHLPTYITKYDHAISNNLAWMLQVELLADTSLRFNIVEKAPQTFSVFFDDKSINYPRRVAQIAIWTREIKVDEMSQPLYWTMAGDYVTERERWMTEHDDRKESFLANLRLQIRRSRRRHPTLWFRANSILNQGEVVFAKQWERDLIKWEQEMKTAQYYAEINNKIQSQLSFLRRFEKYGFKSVNRFSGNREVEPHTR